jgi:hypothetical protein
MSMLLPCLTLSIAAHVSAARSLVLMRPSSPQSYSQRSYNHRYEQQQQQQLGAVEHVSRCMDWCSRVSIPMTPSLRCDVLQVLSLADRGGAGEGRCVGIEAIRSLVTQWRAKGIKLSEKEYVVFILAECNVLVQQKYLLGIHNHYHNSSELLDRLARIVSCAAADGVRFTTAIMNACLSAASSHAATPPSISSVLRLIPLPAPLPCSLTVDIVAASYASAANDDNSDYGDQHCTFEKQLILLFNFKPVIFLSHTLPSPTSSTLVAVVKACIRRNRIPLSVNIMRLACGVECDNFCLITAKACRIFFDGLHRGVIAKTLSPAFRNVQVQEVMEAVVQAAVRGKLAEEEARVCLQALRGE